jgi:hypothetical protein
MCRSDRALFPAVTSRITAFYSVYVVSKARGGLLANPKASASFQSASHLFNRNPPKPPSAFSRSSTYSSSFLCICQRYSSILAPVIFVRSPKDSDSARQRYYAKGTFLVPNQHKELSQLWLMEFSVPSCRYGYVNVTNPHSVYVYDVLPSGRLTNKNFLLATASFDAPYRPVIPDGIKFDMDGRIYLGVADGVQGQQIYFMSADFHYVAANARQFCGCRPKDL